MTELASMVDEACKDYESNATEGFNTVVMQQNGQKGLQYVWATNRCGRISYDGTIPPDMMMIRGFNGTISTPTVIGRNSDGRSELYVRAMEENLTLLCARDYADGVAVVLLPNGGVVLALSLERQAHLMEFIKVVQITHHLYVKNNTYEVLQDELPTYLLTPSHLEEALSASTYFNTNIHISVHPSDV